MSALASIVETQRRASPAPEPQSLAFDGARLWMGSRRTKHLYAIDPRTWSADDAGAAPGTPWGLTAAGDALHAVCGEAPDDNRFLRRYVPGRGFDAERIACPDDTGSYLGFDGSRLYLTQFYRRHVLALAADGRVEATIAVPHDICGCTVVEGRFYLVTTDDENTTEYFLTRIDARGAQPVIDDIAHVPFAARSLAFDGDRFWTNHRECDEIVAFEAPSSE